MEQMSSEYRRSSMTDIGIKSQLGKFYIQLLLNLSISFYTLKCLEYLETNRKKVSSDFFCSIRDDSIVDSYVDCEWSRTDILRSHTLDIPDDSDLIIGYLFTVSKTKFNFCVNLFKTSMMCNHNITVRLLHIGQIAATSWWAKHTHVKTTQYLITHVGPTLKRR